MQAETHTHTHTPMTKWNLFQEGKVVQLIWKSMHWLPILVFKFHI